MHRERKNPDWNLRLYRYQLIPLDDAKSGKPIYEPWKLPGVVEEARAMEGYWNRLVEHAQRASQWYQAIISDSEDVVHLQTHETEIVAQRDALIETIKKQRIATKSKKSQGEEVHKIALGQIKETLKEIRALLKAAKVETRDNRHEQIAEHHKFWEELLRKERQTSEVHWGNREYVLDTFKAALARTRKEGKALLLRSGPLRRIHFRQPYSAGLNVENMFSHQGRVRFTQPQPEKSKRAPRLPMQFQVGNTPLPFTVYYHRPLPIGGRIKYFDVVAEEVIRAGGTIGKSGYRSLAARWDWSVVIAVEFPPEEQQKWGQRQEAGIDVGFRLRPEGLRVAMVVAEDGHTEEFCLPADMVQGLRTEYKLQSQIDELTRIAEEEIRTFDRSTLSGDAIEILRTTKPLTRPKLFRLLRLCTGIPLFEERLQRWAHETTPLYRRIRFDALRRQRRRNDLYRKWAWQLCEDYSALHIEDLNLSRLQQVLEDSLREDPIPQAAKKYQNLAGLSMLFDALLYIAKKANTIIIKKDPNHTTDRCAICGAKAPVSGDLYLTCENGHTWDRDKNAGRNIYMKTQVPSEIYPE